MGLKNYKTLIRDRIVDNTTGRALFNATQTGSCWVNMENLRTTARYPQILIGWAGGESTPLVDADEGRIYLTIECKGTGSTHAYEEISKFRNVILSGLDEKPLSATNVCYWIRKFSEVEGFDNDRKVWWNRIGLDCIFNKTTTSP